jgi:hypothetical protein
LFASVFLMLTRLKLKRGEGELVEPRSQIVSRRTNTPQASIVMAHEEGPEGMSEDERTFRKAFFEMSEMVKVLYEERNSRLYERAQNLQKEMEEKETSLQKGMEGMVTNHHLHLHPHPHLHLSSSSTSSPFTNTSKFSKGTW